MGDRVEPARRPWVDLDGAALDVRPRRVAATFALSSPGAPLADVVAPDTAAGREAAAIVVERVRELGGAAPPVVAARWPDGAWVPEGGPGTLAGGAAPSPYRVRVTLGGLSTNPLLAALYHAQLCPVDAAFPGPGGRWLRTMSDPWGDGVDLVVVGASRDEDLLAAARAMAARLRATPSGVALEHVHDVVAPASPVGRLLQQGSFADAGQVIDVGQVLEDDERIRERARHAYRTRAHRGMTPYLSRAALAFNLTGQARFARQYLAIFRDMMEEVAAWEPDQWGRLGFDADFQAVPMISGWHAIADSPLLSDEDRRHVTAHLLQYLGNNEDEWRRHRHSTHPARHNHYTFASLGLLYGALTLCRAHGLTELEERWTAMADECLQPQIGAAKPTEDCESYGWLTLSHTLRYALLRPVPAYFREGMCAAVVDRGIVAMDNLGYQVPHGDARAHRGSGSELGFWRPAAWALGCARHVAAVERKAAALPVPAVYGYDVPRPGGELAPAEGEVEAPRAITVTGLDPAYVASYPETAPADGFDKLALRDGLSPERPYLLIDGVGTGGHGHRDANAIVRLTSRDRIWLEDADYDKTAAHFHNTVVVTRDGVAGPRPPYARLVGVAEKGGVALARTALDGVAGARWLRATALLPGLGVLVVDRVVAGVAGRHDVACMWRTAGPARLEGDALAVDMAPETLRIASVGVRGGEPERRLLTERYVRADWDRYPYAAPEVTVCRVAVEADLGPGEDAVLVHALADAGEVELRALGGGRVRARAAGRAVDVDVDALCEGRLDAVAPAASEEWSLRTAPGAVTALVDLDGDGGDELVVAAPEGGLRAYRGGRELWSAPTAGPVTALGRVDGGAVLAGEAGGNVELFGGDGARRWHRTFQPHMEHPATVRVAFGARLDRPVAVIATESCHIHAFALDGEELWRHEVVHAATAAAAADLDGDGRDEILAGTEYWQWHCLDADGTARFGPRGVEGSGCGGVAAWALPEGALALFGGWDGHVTAYRGGGERAWDIALGEVVTAISPAEAGALVAIRGGRACCLAADGAPRWHRRFAGEVAGACRLPGAGRWAVAAGDEVLVLSADGAIAGRWRPASRPVHLERGTYQGAEGVCVRREDGAISWLADV